MIKKRIIPALLSCILIVAALIFGTSFNTTKKASANYAYADAYETWYSIPTQGENGLYACWGTPEHYKLMEYGVWSNNMTWLGVENYQYCQGGGVHPGNNFATLIVWVANRSGTIRLYGHDADWKSTKHPGFYKQTKAGSSTNSDGTAFGIFHQKVTGGAPIAIMARSIKLNAGDYTTDVTFNITKGDTLIFSIDCGDSNCNVDDGAQCNFRIEYTKNGSDYDASEDMSQYLKVGNAGLIAGYKPMSGNFQADKLFGSVSVDTEETTIIIRSTSSSATSANASVISVAPIACTFVALALVLIAVKYIKARRKD